jgi:hypothetical protein
MRFRFPERGMETHGARRYARVQRMKRRNRREKADAAEKQHASLRSLPFLCCLCVGLLLFRVIFDPTASCLIPAERAFSYAAC